MENNGNTLAKLSSEIGLMLSPLKQALASPPAFAGFMQQLGWQADDIPAPLSDLAAAVTSLLDLVEALSTEEFDIDRITELKNAIRDIVQAIRAIASAPDALIPERLREDNFKSEFPTQLLAYLITKYLFTHRSGIAFALQAAGIIKIRIIPASGNRVAYAHYAFDFDDIPETLQSPSKVLENAFGWGTPEFNFDEFVQVVENLFARMGLVTQTSQLDPLAVHRVRGSVPSLTSISSATRTVQIVFFDTIDSDGDGLAGTIDFLKLPLTETLMPGFAILPHFKGAAGTDIELGPRTTINIKSEAEIEGGIAILARPSTGIKLVTGFNGSDNPSQANASFTVSASINPEEANPIILIGSAEGSRIEYMGMVLAGGIKIDSSDGLELFSEFQLKEFKILVDLSKSDGFLRTIIPVEKIEANADLVFGISNRKGFYFSGSSSLDITIPTHISLGPFEINNTVIRIIPKRGKITTSAGVSIKASLGPVTVIVNEIGITADLLFPPESEFLDFSLGFKPPSGIGLSVDAGGIKGGGILNFDPEKGEYFGAMELEFKDLFSLKAFGIINTILPDGSKGFSLLIIITAEFNPIQLGFGFTLNGVGGLLGLNRTAKIEVLKEGIKTNSIKSILFPENIVANINRIVSDIKQVFPAQKGHFLIAPMAKIGWGTPTIITLEMGLLIEIPATRLVILGVLKALLPKADAPLLQLQVNFIGDIDFDNKSISFDAVLYDSRLLTYTLSGQMALRIAWGDRPVFVLSVGGFHPAFKEIPAGLEQMQRVTIGLLNTSNARITIQNYFAVTSNTVQFGAKAELYASNGGSWNIYGFIGYDVLFQFDPFHFIADFAAGLALRRNESVVMGIRVSGSLAGPSPWDAKGEASVSFFFFSISIPFHETWGSNPAPDTTERADLTQLLTDLLADNRSWTAGIPANKKMHVSLKEITQTGDKLVIHPFGVLTFSERLVPLGIEIEKFGNKLPKDTSFFEIDTNHADLKTEPVREQFAPANFLNMTDAEKLSIPSFEAMKSGFSITRSESLQAPMEINKSVEYEFTYLGRKPVNFPLKDKYWFEKLSFRAGTKGGSIANSALSYTRSRISLNAPLQPVVEDERFVVANVSNMALYNEEMAAASYTEAAQYYQQLLKTQPSLSGQIQVLSAFELNNN